MIFEDSYYVNFMKERYVVKIDNENECYKIIDTGTLIETTDQPDYVHVADVFEEDDVINIVNHLNTNPTRPPNTQEVRS